MFFARMKLVGQSGATGASSTTVVPHPDAFATQPAAETFNRQTRGELSVHLHPFI